MNPKLTCLLLGALALASFTLPAQATELLTNGNFESGTCGNLNGWTIEEQFGGRGDFYGSAPGSNTPDSGFSTAANAAGGACYAVSAQSGPSAEVLIQSFTVAAGSTVTLTFQMFDNNYAGTTEINPAGLDYTADPNQHARVDILTGSATAFDTGSGVLDNLYLGSTPATLGNPNPWVDYSFDLTSLLGGGGSFQLRFGDVESEYYQNLGVDNISIDAVPSGVPEPSGLGVLALGLLGLAGVTTMRRRRAG